MVKTLATAVMDVAALVPAPVKKAEKPPLAQLDSLVVKVMPQKAERVDGNYLIEGEQKTADERYNELKAALDERFKHMFELKAALDKAQSAMSSKWNEYYALSEKYNKELKKIIAAWVTENNYVNE